MGKWLDELAQELRSRTYQPQPVRRVWIPKPDGKQRPLGVPAIIGFATRKRNPERLSDTPCRTEHRSDIWAIPSL